MPPPTRVRELEKVTVRKPVLVPVPVLVLVLVLVLVPALHAAQVEGAEMAEVAARGLATALRHPARKACLRPPLSPTQQPHELKSVWRGRPLLDQSYALAVCAPGLHSRTTNEVLMP